MYYLLIFFGAAITATIFFMLVVMAIVSHKKNVDSRNKVEHYVEIESEKKLQETIRINKIIISGDLFGDNSVEFDPIISSQTR